MGLWDSINSVGIFYDKMFPHASSTGSIRHIRHAISIDERRGKFKQYPFSELYYTFAGKYNNTTPNTSESSLSTNSANEDKLGGFEENKYNNNFTKNNYNKKIVEEPGNELHIVSTNQGMGTFDVELDSTSTGDISPKSTKKPHQHLHKPHRPSSKHKHQHQQQKTVNPKQVGKDVKGKRPITIVDDDKDIKKEKKRLENKLKKMDLQRVPTDALANVAFEEPKPDGSFPCDICEECANADNSSKKSTSQTKQTNINNRANRRRLHLSPAKLEKLNFFRRIFQGNNSEPKSDKNEETEHEFIDDDEFVDSGFSSLGISSVTNSSQPESSTSVSSHCQKCRRTGSQETGLCAPPNSVATTMTNSIIKIEPLQLSPLDLNRCVSCPASISPMSSLNDEENKRSSSVCSLCSAPKMDDEKPVNSSSDADDESQSVSDFSTESILSDESSQFMSVQEVVLQRLNRTIWSPDEVDSPEMNFPTRRNVYGINSNVNGCEVGIHNGKDNGGSGGCQDVIELWFPGDHSDVGGGWPRNSNNAMFSDVALRWMIGEAWKAGVIFRKGAVDDYCQLHPLIDSLNAPLHNTLDCRWKSSQDDELGRGDKSLLSSVFWWLLEVLPIPTYRFNNVKDLWTRTFVPNMGKHRVIPLNAKFHWSVSWKEAYGTNDKDNNGGRVFPYHPPNLLDAHERTPLSKSAKENPPDDIAEAKRFKRAHGSGSAAGAVARRRIARKKMQQKMFRL